MAEIAEEGVASSENETTSDMLGSTESIDLSCIHWGYLNCTLLTDPKKVKDSVWQTYWVDLCGSTLRLYKDLSLPSNSADTLPPGSLIGPANENEKKEAFIILNKGTQVSIVDAGFEPHKSRKRLTINRRHVFRVSFVTRGTNSQAPSYLFQAPSKGSMYRWISKIEEGVDMADKPQNESATDKRLKEAKLLSMEQRRCQMIPEVRYPDRDDVDSGMEGDVEEAYDISKKLGGSPHLDILMKRLKEMEDLVLVLEKEEEAFLGAKDSKVVRRCEFQSTTNKDYLLIPGHPHTLIPKGTEITILGQLSNNRWRCCVDLPKKTPAIVTNGTHSNTSSEVESISSFEINDEDGFINSSSNTETFIGSVPTSLIVELSRTSASRLKHEDGTPVASPEETPQLSPYPSPPLSPYFPHKRESLPNNKRSSLRRSIASENLSEQDIWEQFCLPSPPSSPATSRSTSPSLSMSGSLGGSLEELDFGHTTRIGDENTGGNLGDEKMGNEIMGGGTVDNQGGFPRVALRQRNEGGEGNVLRRHREAILMDDNVPETYIGSDSEDDRKVTVIDEVPPHEPREAAHVQHEPVKLRQKKEKPPRDFDNESVAGPLQPNFAFLVTKKLRQRGISLIVGSSSSEDEGDDGSGPGSSSKLSLRRLDDEFNRYEEEATGKGIRPYSAFVPMKRASITLRPGTQTFVPRKSTKDELLRDYSSPAGKIPVIRANTCTTIEQLGDWSSTENAPPINQRRTLQLSKNSSAGFGFTLQTYGIVQQEGEVEYMTFVLSVEEDGPAYMAGLRPGDVILDVDGKNVEEDDHKAIVTLIHGASESLRLVVVFVDALRKMKMNTRLKLLQAELADREREFEDLSKKEEDLIKGKGCPSLDSSLLELTTRRGKTGSYLCTTELTSAFSKKSSEVHDSLLQYRQPVQDIRPRPCSLPDETNLGKQRIAATTSSEILQNFSSPDLSAQGRKTVSNKLIKSFRKKKPSVESFKSYVDLDLNDQNSEEAGSENSSSGVFRPAISMAELTTAVSTKVESRSSECEAAATNSCSSRNGKANSLSPNDEKDFSVAVAGPSENFDSTYGSRVAPGIAELRRRLEKSPRTTARTLPPTPPKPMDNSKAIPVGTKSLPRPELQNAR